MARALLIRHCQSTGQAPEAPLSDLGRRQAEDLVPWLQARGVDHVVSSPYARAVATLRPFSDATGLPLHLDDRLHERVIAPEPIDHWREVIKRSFVDPAHHEPGGESGQDVLERATSAIVSVLDAGHTLPALASHGHLLALFLQSIDRSFGFAEHAAMTNPDAYLLERTPEGLRFERVWSDGA
ncbi:MAG: histidine phosphatase family protein [Myxococcota bacterium]